jgi:hypothetical protein
MSLPRLTVNLDGPTGHHGRVYLDGHDISGGLQELAIRFSHSDLTIAEIVLAVGELEVDAPTLLLLQANVKVTDPPKPDEPEFRTFGDLQEAPSA